MSRRLPEIITAVEEKNLLDQFSTRYFVPHRNKLMIELALETGMRISELINLKFEDITPYGNAFKVHIKQGKGDKDRMLFIREERYSSLVELHHIHGLYGYNYVFPNHKGTPLDSSYLRRMIKKKGTAAGIPRIHFHLLRHTFLTRLYTKTKDIRLTQEAAGHSSINTTMIYTHTSGEAIREAMLSV